MIGPWGAWTCLAGLSRTSDTASPGPPGSLEMPPRAPPCPSRRAHAGSGLKLKAVVCEARPLCEGVALAEAWAAAGVEVTLITDAQARARAPPPV